MRDLVRHLIKALEQDRELIVCQVVETRGSTPQKAGSMMIIDPEGGQVGHARRRLRRERGQTEGHPADRRESAAAVHSFVLDHDYAWADGLICGGKMVILTQPVRGTGPLDYFRTLDQVIEEGRGFTEAIVVDDKQAGGARAGHAVLVRRRGSAAGQLAGRRGARRTRRADHSARRSTQAVGSRRDRVLAELAADPADHRRGRARRARPSPAWPRRRTSTSGSSTTAINTPIASGFPTAQRLLVGPIDEVLRHARDHSADLCPDRDARAWPRPGSPLPSGPDRGVLRRADRQPPQDPADFREPARSGHRRDGPGARDRAGRPGYRLADRCPRSRSASWPS